MPTVLLFRKPERGLEELAKNLARELPMIIAAYLSTKEGGYVQPKSIKVRHFVGDPEDVNTDDLEIRISAHNFPEREANLEERKNSILEDVRDFLRDYDRNLSVLVLVHLAPMAFGKIE